MRQASRFARQKAMRRAGLAAVSAAALVGLAACGGSSSGGSQTSGNNGSSANGKTIIWGSTDKPVSFDPAGSYDLPSWNVVYNVYQTLLRVDPSTEKTVPDAAQSCNPSKDFKTWTCTLKPGQKFSNGDAVTAEDVKFSFERVLKINDPSGPAALLQAGGSDTSNPKKIKDFTVDAPNATTVVFHLQHANALWNQFIATGAGAIVDHNVFPADKKIADDKIVGSGPYELKSYQPSQVAQFVPNPHYGGDLHLNNSGLVIQYYQDENALKLDVQQGKVDVVYPGLSPTAIDQLKGKSGINVVSGPGGAIRYLVFNLKTMPGSNDAQKRAIRRAVAYLIDRQSIATNVYKNTVQPLYSMVPKGLAGQEDVYKTEFGASPDPAKAKAELQKAGVKTPVNLQIWWTPSHYGALSSDEYTEIKRELEGSNLFKIDLQSTEWEQYTGNCLADKCPAYQLGWFPDYPDTDDYLSSFFGSASFLNNHYSNPQVDRLIDDEQGTTDQNKRIADFKKIQEATVADAPVIPYWQGQQIAITNGTINGLQSTLTPDYIFRFWVLGKS
ncbi:MAG TPA: ABC transporter substrate-binding protein [Mycobacteriales bacterium]|nr:ABC transporter substrate-binding protein [Mycobacteriales bacterium]